MAMASRTGERRNSGRRGRRGMAVLLSATMLCTAPITPVRAQGYSFSNVRIEGNERVDDATILSYGGIGRGAAVSAGELNDAYQRIVASGLFKDVSITPSGNTLVIRVEEYPTINVVDFEGNARIRDEQLSSVVKSKSAEVYSPAKVEADAAAIAEAYANAARVAARVEPKIIKRTDNRVDVVFEIQEGKLTEIQRLAFTGNQAYSDRRLRDVVATKQAGWLHTLFQNDTYIPDRIELDKRLLTDFYRSRGYVDFQVLGVASDMSPERDGYYLTYNVREGKPFRFGKVSVVSEVPGVDAALFDGAESMRAGATYSPNAVDLTISRMEAIATRAGLEFIRIEPRVTRNDATQTLDVTFAVMRGPRVFVERIDIEGNATTLDRVIRRQFRSVEGDPFDPNEIRQSAERIRKLGFFSASDVNTRQGSAPDQVIVDTNVTEQPTGSLSFGVSYGVDVGVGFAISFAERNFLGRGQYFGASINTTDSTGESSVTFREPAFLGRDMALSFQTYYRTYDNDNSDYSMKLIGIEPSIEFPLTETARLNLGLKFGQEKLYDLDADESSAILVDEEGTRNSIGASYELNYDSDRNGLDPINRLQLKFGQELLGFGGDVDAVKTTASATYERKVKNEEWTLRAAVEGGAINSLDGSTRVTERFFANQMRGFSSRGIGPRDMSVENEDPLGGNFYALTRFEAEFPLGIPEDYGIRGGVFLDVGSVWGLDETDGGYNSSDGLDMVDDSFKPRAAVGFSVFWTTPIGPLRFNFSKALKKEDYDDEQTFDLTVSTQF